MRKPQLFAWRLLRPRYWGLWLGYALLRLVGFLPFGAIVALGIGAGRLAMRLAPRRAHIARVNIAHCLPESPPETRELTVRRHFEALGVSLLGNALSWFWSASALRPLIHVEGLVYLQEAIATGRGVILLGAHFTDMEVGIRLLDTLVDTPIHIVYQAHSNPLLERIIVGNRDRHSGSSIKHTEIREMVKALKAGDIVWYAPDQAYGGKYTAPVPFFGIPALSNTATPRLAEISGACVVPFFMRRLSGTQGYALTLYPALDHYPSADPVADTARYYQLIELETRKAPEQYLWVHRRFKDTRPEMYR
ncbi:MAG: lipid A biosynthesis acyltransferase [Gammaproteobacteria bacterium]|nr:lipid A biosynthesis acyltransferase [Gammaproteobacteria bacterium]